MDYHCANLWVDNSGSGMGFYPTANYGAAENDAAKQVIIDLQHLRSKILILWIINLLTTDVKHKLREFNT